MSLDAPQLIFEFSVSRRQYTRRVVWLIASVLAVTVAWLALETVRNSDQAVDSLLLDAGQWVALLLIAVQTIRLFVTLYRAVTTPNESGRVYDRGFVWVRGKNSKKKQATEYKYGWGQVRSFKAGIRSLDLFGRPIAQRGAQTLHMRDGETFRFTARHGDPRAFAAAISPYLAETTGTLIGRALRNGKAVRLHPQLVLQAKGVIAGQHKIRWSEIDIKTQGGRVVVRRLQDGKFKTVKTYDIHDVDNVPGLLDIADSTIRNHQPQRFNIATHEGS